jgi:hypothetical protein
MDLFSSVKKVPLPTYLLVLEGLLNLMLKMQLLQGARSIYFMDLKCKYMLIFDFKISDSSKRILKGGSNFC